MALKLINKKNFYFDFYERRTAPSTYRAIYYKGRSEPVFTQKEESDALNAYPIVVSYFPSYFTPQIDSRQELQFKKLFRARGYCMALEKAASAEAFLNTHFKPNFRTALRRRLKALDTCFNVRYRLFFGEIERKDYDFIMEILQQMLVRRFNQRNDEHMLLKSWNRYYSSTFQLINEEKASLYVIYDESKPIQIALSYHFDKILFLAIPSYDIDYAKYGLGNIAIQKLLEWCVDNNYEMLDMGFGAFDYKVKWCNEAYDFENHLFYRSSSVLSNLIVPFVSLKTKLINYLLDKNVNLLYKRFKSMIAGKKKSDLREFRMENLNNNFLSINNLQRVDPLKDDSYSFLSRAVYDFVYTRLEHVSEIAIYEETFNKTYYIKGVKDTVKISF